MRFRKLMPLVVVGASGLSLGVLLSSLSENFRRLTQSEWFGRKTISMVGALNPTLGQSQNWEVTGVYTNEAGIRMTCIKLVESGGTIKMVAPSLTYAPVGSYVKLANILIAQAEKPGH